ncbi:MAG: tetratricopeptide repeat protein [Leptospiraceae bacterium]|nr:tetratricopeptide repeat protein [Leptospiraceae bacterium]MDW8307657.1 tetratricopeptide repeat protein [Leptospiraceae bacterium]
MVSSLFASPVDSYVQKGLTHFLQRQYYEAENAFAEAINLDPKNVEILALWAESRAFRLRSAYCARMVEILYDQGRLNQAKDLLRRCRAIYPGFWVFEKLDILIREALSSPDPLAKLSEENKKQYRDFMENGEKAFRIGNYAEALEYFSRALALSGKSIEAMEAYTRAQAAYREELYRDKLYELLKKAEIAEKEKKLPLAIKFYREVLSYDRQNQYAADRIRQLEEYLEKEREKENQRRLAQEYLRSGNEYLAKNLFLEAMEQYRLGLGMFPNLANWQELLRIAEQKYEEYQRRQFEEKLKEISERFEKALINFARENFREAIVELDHIVEISRYYNQSETMKQAEELLAVARENLKIQEEEVISEGSAYYGLYSSLFELGRQNYEAGKYNEAKHYFTLILQIFPGNRQANRYLILSRIKQEPQAEQKIFENLFSELTQHVEKKQFFEARRLYFLLMELIPNDKRLKSLEKEILREKKLSSPKPSLAQEEKYRKALSISQNEPEKAIALCKEVLLENRDFVRCRSLIASIEGRLSRANWLKLEPKNENARLFYSQGLLHYNGGRIEEAIRSFRKALEADPNFEKARVALERCLAYTGSS